MLNRRRTIAQWGEHIMGNFADVLIDEGKRKNSVLVVGLDPDINFFPEVLLENVDTSSNESIANAIYEFNKIIIDAVADHVIAVKPQSHITRYTVVTALRLWKIQLAMNVRKN
jgi:hypothetical protein